MGSGAFPGFNTSPWDVSVFPGPGSRVSGCSYIDFRGIVLIDTCWWYDTSVCNPQTLTTLTKEEQAICFIKLIHKATRIQDFKMFAIYLGAYLNRLPLSFFLKEQVSSLLSHCLLFQLPPWFGLISLNRDIHTVSDFLFFGCKSVLLCCESLFESQNLYLQQQLHFAFGKGVRKELPFLFPSLH